MEQDEFSQATLELTCVDRVAAAFPELEAARLDKCRLQPTNWYRTLPM
jgi:hypothetical protein